MRLSIFAAAIAASVSLVSSAFAGTMLQPASATTPMGSYDSSYVILHAIDKTGMASSYTSGVTDFATYTSTVKTSGGSNGGNAWFSPSANRTGNVDFNLGGSFFIASIAIWPDFQGIGQTMKDFTVLADDNASFSSPDNLGSFVLNDGTTTEANNFAQVFNFATTSASYVRLQITSNHGSTVTTGFSELAFNAVPEPGSLAAVGLIAGLGLLRRRAHR